MEDLSEMTYDIDELMRAIDLNDYDHEEIEQAFDGFFSRCDRTQQEHLLAILTNVMGVDDPRRLPDPPPNYEAIAAHFLAS